jgi:DNA-binding FadR family transcriptional regulator
VRTIVDGTGTTGSDREPDRVSAPSDEKLAAQVARLLEDEIIERGWPVGEVLGSETELRRRFGVSRSVLREAVRLLEHEQVGRMRRGPAGGLVVTAPDASPATRALVIYLEYVGTRVEDLLRARSLLEPLVAGRAAEEITEDGIAELRSVVDRERGRDGDPGPPAEDEIHLLLGRLSGNAVLQLFTEVLIRLTQRYAQAARGDGEVAAAQARSASRHVEIVEAVCAGDGAAARSALSAHLGEIEAWLLTHQERPSAPMRTRPADPDPDPEPRERRKGGEVLAGRLHDDITCGDGRQVGEVLGSEAELLARYGVSRAVLREAVRILEHHSVAQMRRGPGGGLVVLAPDPTASIHTMALYLDHQGLEPGQLRVVREAIELGCVRAATAAAPADGAAAGRLRAALDQVDAFHTALAETAGNPVLSLFLRICTELSARQARVGPAPSADAATEVRDVHERILDAVLLGDEGLALHRMRRHLRSLTTC